MLSRMKRCLVGLFVTGLVAIWSCSSEPTHAAKSNVTTADASAASDAATKEGVECTHPGAGPSIGGDRCACVTTRNVAGDWNTKRTCREGDACPARDKTEAFVLTQDGTSVRAERADGYAISGKLCGDVLIWSGGPKDGFNPECGQLRF